MFMIAKLLNKSVALETSSTGAPRVRPAIHSGDMNRTLIVVHMVVVELLMIR